MAKQPNGCQLSALVGPLVGSFRFSFLLMSSEDGTHSGFQNVISKYTSHILQKSQNQKTKKWLLHHDNTLTHPFLVIHDFLIKLKTMLVPQPPYSPDIAQVEFSLFPKLKYVLKGLFESV
jgi:hypothetical protein